MILKRQEKDGIIKAMYESSNILASIYDTDTNDLTIIYSSGSKYKYPNVSKTDYTRFETADSQGKIFNSHIKKYIFEKMDPVDPTKILEEVTILKVDEDKALRDGLKLDLTKTMQSLVSNVDNFNDTIYKDGLLALQTKISNYLK